MGTEVKCPQCSKKFIYDPKNEFRPFCSERCKMIDLGHWFEGSYTVPSKEPLSEEDLERALREGESDD